MFVPFARQNIDPIQVYDVTKYKGEHPGGEDIILQQAGRDATEQFKSVGHTPGAIDTLQTLQIGEIVKNLNETEQAYDDSKPASDPYHEATYAKNGATGSLGVFGYMLLTAAVIGIGYFVQRHLH